MRRLLIRPGAIGDLIVSLPALESLRADYTEVWVAGQNVPLIRFADKVRSIQSTGLDMIELGRASTAMLESFDEIVSWYGASREEFRAAVRRLPFRFHEALPKDGTMHATDFYCAQVGATMGLIPHIDVPGTRGNYAVIHPYSGSARKNWPIEKFQQVAERLSETMQVEWAEFPEGKHRFTDLYELARWIGGAKLYVGNDSGITHLAAAVGTPTVAIFGVTNPKVWAPRGEDVRVIYASHHAKIKETSLRWL